MTDESDVAMSSEAWARRNAVQRAIFHSDVLAASEKLLLLAIEHAADNATGRAGLGLKAIALKMGVDYRSAQRVVAAANVRAWLEIEPEAGPFGTNVYRVVPPADATEWTPPSSVGGPRPSSNRSRSTSSTRGTASTPRQDATPGMVSPPPGMVSPILSGSHTRKEETGTAEVPATAKPKATVPTADTSRSPCAVATAPIELVQATDPDAVLRMLRSYPVFVEAEKNDHACKANALARVAGKFAGHAMVAGIPDAHACEAITSAALMLDASADASGYPPPMEIVARTLGKHLRQSVLNYKSGRYSDRHPRPNAPTSRAPMASGVTTTTGAATPAAGTSAGRKPPVHPLVIAARKARENAA